MAPRPVARPTHAAAARYCRPISLGPAHTLRKASRPAYGGDSPGGSGAAPPAGVASGGGGGFAEDGLEQFRPRLSCPKPL